MNRARRRLAGLLCAVLWGATATVAAADWLVTGDGARVETRGPWEVKGRQVVFRLPNGTLSSLRLAEVDLEASASATAEAQKPPPEPEPPEPENRPPPILVVTNEDIRSGAAPAPAAGAGGESGAGGAASESAAPGRPAAASSDDGRDVEIQLLTWKAQLSDTVGGLEIVGTLRNVGTDPAAKVEVGVTIPDENGETLFETTAFVRSAGLAPGRHTNFRALLPNIYQLAADPVFDVRAVFFTGGEAPQAGNR
ncbi:MAG: FxLYD domain-containing protein [Thermoanaerobaculia bacterium]